MMDNKELIKGSLKSYIKDWNKEKKSVRQYKKEVELDPEVQVPVTVIRDTDALRAIQLLAQIEGMLTDKGDSIDVAVIRPKFKIR